MDEPLTYKDSGVNYDAMDPFKRAAQLAARKTANNICRLNNGEFKEFEPSRGESAYLIETPDSFWAHVEEGLGTKNRIADVMWELTGLPYDNLVAQCTVAMIVNDMITVGALPLSVAMHLAVGDAAWFENEPRVQALIQGWKQACDMARCVWGGGETPTLKDIVMPGTAVLSGSAMGIVKPKERLISADTIRAGDVILLLESSGIHANGLTLARRIAERRDPLWRLFAHCVLPRSFPLRALPNGYKTVMPDGRFYGEVLLDPTHIYVAFVEDCLDRGLQIDYAVNITGHGWRKLMRAPQPFAYIIEKLPQRRAIFDFIEKHGPVARREMYGNYNMGAGFALIGPRRDLTTMEEMLGDGSYGYRGFIAGRIEESATKRVVIEPEGIEFAEDELQVR